MVVHNDMKTLRIKIQHLFIMFKLPVNDVNFISLCKEKFHHFQLFTLRIALIILH